MTLRGVGRKTANVVLGVAFGKPGFAVDTHVTRLTGRLKLTSSHRSRRDRDRRLLDRARPRSGPTSACGSSCTAARCARRAARAVRSACSTTSAHRCSRLAGVQSGGFGTRRSGRAPWAAPPGHGPRPADVASPCRLGNAGAGQRAGQVRCGRPIRLCPPSDTHLRTAAVRPGFGRDRRLRAEPLATQSRRPSGRRS